jgi:hypothetical protein
MTVLRHVWPPTVTRTGARTRPNTPGTSSGTGMKVPSPSAPITVSKRALGTSEPYRAGTPR